MGFIVRSAAVIGLVYLTSPLRPPLPEWLARPAGSLAPEITESLSKTVEGETRRAPEKSAKGPEMISVAALKASLDTLAATAMTACAGHEKTCVTLAARAAKVGSDGDPLAALIGADPSHAAPAHATVESRTSDVLPVIPLPPRRDAPAETQKKI